MHNVHGQSDQYPNPEFWTFFSVKIEIEIWSKSEVWNPNKCLGPDPKMKKPRMRSWIPGTVKAVSTDQHKVIQNR